MLIRALTDADIPAILTLERECASAAHWTEEQYHHILESSTPSRLGLVVELDSRLAGFLVARGLEGEWEIENILIAAVQQRRGLGTRLLAAFLDSLRKLRARAVLLEVRESNQPARSLYRKAGFIETGRRRGYYRDPAEDAITCRAELS